MDNSNILILGCNGFIGSSIFKYFQTSFNLKCLSVHTNSLTIRENIAWANIIIHAIGVSRSIDENDFFRVNINFSKNICDELLNCVGGKKLIYFSSIHFNRNDLYGFSKRYNEFIFSNEDLVSKHQVYIIRTPGIFGPGSLPNNLSVVSTFCYNIVNNIDCVIRDENSQISLLFIDDLISLVKSLFECKERFNIISPKTDTISVGNLYKLISSFYLFDGKKLNSFESKIFQTYNSFLNAK
jgi:UDP-2-acetamido-2,6-beta-L-arabino-hexul-4-ose reductase